MTPTTYASIGVSRIQTHLSRSRKLWGRRGASEDLVLLTRASESKEQTPPDGEPYLVDQILRGHKDVRTNSLAPNIDGEVSVQGADEEAVLARARVYAEALQSRLPALHISIRWMTTDEPYPEVLGHPLSDWEHVDFLPQIYEYPLIQLCDLCGIDPATREHQRNGDQMKLCADCARRTDRPGRWSTLNGKQAKKPGVPSRFTAEYELLRWVREKRSTPAMKTVEDFEDLAKLTKPAASGRTRTHRQHLALIFADGNGLGALFDKLRADAHNDDADKFRKVSKAMKDATTTALHDATDAVVFDRDTLLPVIPHIVGGDDVLVSLPAERAWNFLGKFLGSLKDSLHAHLRGLVPDELIPTISAGVVICHHAYPFANQVELAEDLLKRAKRHVRGKDYSFTWLDVTAEGTTPLAKRTPWTLQNLQGQAEALAMLNDSEFAASSEASIRRTLAIPNSADRKARMDLLASRMPKIQEFLEAVQPIDGQSRNQTISDLISLQRWYT